MSTLEVNKITPVSGGTTVQVGESGDTINIPAGATIANAGTATGFGVSLANGADNRVVTASSASALNGEANLTFDGNEMTVQGTPVVVGTNSSSVLDLKNTNSSADGRAVGIAFSTNSGGSANAHITAVQDANNKGTLNFGGYNGTSTRNIVMSVDAGNNFAKVTNRLIVDGQIDSIAKINVMFGGDAENGMQFSDKDGAASGKFIGFSRNGTSTSNQGTQIGYISRNGSNDSVTYSTTSDYRLKDGIVDKTDGIEKLKQLKPRKFYWKSNTDKTLVDGFIAHEVSGIVPEAIGGEKDAVDSEGNPIYQGIDQSKLVPLLTSALQEAITKIETLETEMTALKARVQTLESA